VDDEVRILAALRRALRREGYEILTAESALEALRVLDGRAVDLILSDHKMPGMSGIELFDKASRLRPGVRKVLITGWTEAVPREELARVGVNALIPKPWDDAQLKQTLREVLSG
jgi:CheY-like chemotaxis protein